MVNLCYTCLKWGDRKNCPLYDYTPKYISRCSAYLHSGINITLKLQERIEYLEKHVKDLKEKYHKTYQTIYHGAGKSRIEELEDFEDNLVEDTVNAVDKVENQIAELRKNIHTIGMGHNHINLMVKVEALEKQREKFNWCGLRDDFQREIAELGDKLQKCGVKWDFRLDEQWGFITELKKGKAEFIISLTKEMEELKEQFDALHKSIAFEAKSHIKIEEVLREFMNIVKRICHNLKVGKPIEFEWDEMWESFKLEIGKLEEKLDGKDGEKLSKCKNCGEFIDNLGWCPICMRINDGEKTGLVIPSFEDVNPTNNSLRESDSKPFQNVNRYKNSRKK